MPLKDINTIIRKGKALVKGRGTPIFQGTSYRYDPSDGVYYKEDKYGGSADAIASFSSQLSTVKAGHSAEVDEGKGTLVRRVPLATVTGDVEERYEIVSEFIEKDLFAHPAVSDASIQYDRAIGSEGDTTFRKTAENAVENHLPSGMKSTIGNKVIKHLKNGITGYERENLVIRRYRKAPAEQISGWPVSLLEGRYIYTTAQLGLPYGLAFEIPDITDGTLFPVSIPGEVKWGWRRRPSSSVFSREFVEQSCEFVLAEWSLLLYEESTGDASW
jgi:hypothetical protein